MPSENPRQQRGHFTRIEKVLDYIHTNIRMPLTLDLLADASCWSRWQLQRVFQAYTGYSVAQYVREMKLSRSAEMVLSGQYRMSDIAYEFGFNSEVAFSRAFKQYFGLSPKAYQNRGARVGIKAPLTNPNRPDYLSQSPHDVFYQVRIDHAKEVSVHSISASVKGLYAESPDFTQTIPTIWESFLGLSQEAAIYQVPHIGVIEERTDQSGELVYRAGIEPFDGMPPAIAALPVLKLPAQHYAVMRYQGEVSHFQHAVIWLLSSWLPESGYIGVENAAVIEFYFPPFLYDEASSRHKINAEYWMPIHL